LFFRPGVIALGKFGREVYQLPSETPQVLQFAVVTSETESAGSSERLLLEADRLVRAGKATLDGAHVMLPLDAPVGVSAGIELPLPPEPFEPRLLLAREAETEVDPARWPRDARRLRPVLRGSMAIESGDEGVVVTWTPDARLALSESLALFRGACEHLIVAAVQTHTRLWQTLDDHRSRGDRLRARFSAASLSSAPDIGPLHIIASDPDGRLVAGQRDADLLAPGAGRGFFIGLRLPESSEPLERIGAAIAEAARKRFGCALRTDDDYAHLLGVDDFDDVVMLVSVPSEDRNFNTHLDDISDVVRFCRSLAELSWSGVPIDALLDFPEEVEVVKAEEESFEDKRARIWGDTPATPDSPERRAPTPSKAKAEAKPEKPKNEIDQLSARDVVKRLTGLDMPSNFDVFMTHPGYNVEKTTKIMSIVLGVTVDEAVAICEAAPCAVVEGVTKAKATQIRTMLEGTGAKVRVVTND